MTAPSTSPLRWRLPLLMFVLTVVSTLYIGAEVYAVGPPPKSELIIVPEPIGLLAQLAALGAWLSTGWTYAVPLLAILLCHEFGHYAMARRHRVPASLPFFIPVPLPPFGTLGAVIRMRDRIRSRDALLDIGAAGPLAGMSVAVPVTLFGLHLSSLEPVEAKGIRMQEGVSLLYAALRWIAKGPLPANHDVFLHPVAMAGWVGMFVTMMNLIPYGQLDGGHVAYALFGRLHDRIARAVLLLLPLLGLGTGLYWGTVLRRQHRDPWEFGAGYTQGFSWVVFALLVWGLHRGTAGRHPPTDDEVLSPRRRWIAVATLALFALLFMPVPLRLEVFDR